MSVGTEVTDKLGLHWNLTTNDTMDPDALNNVSLVLEKAFATGLLTNLMENGVITRENIVGGIDESTGRIERPSLGEPLVGLVNGKAFIMTNAHEAEGSVDSATTTTLVDTGLPGDNGFWVNAWVVFTSGDNDGIARQVTDYDDTNHELSWSSPLDTAPSAGDTFVVTFYYVQDYTAGATNYVFVVERSATPTEGKIGFEARTDSEKLSGDVLLGKVVLDADASPTSVDNEIDDADRNLWYGAGAVDYRKGYVTLEWDAIEGTGVDLTITHDIYLLRGAIDVSLDDSDCSWEVRDASQNDRTTVRILKEASTADTVTATLEIWGRLKRYPG